jgi:nitrogenase iron protein NifH
MYRFAIYGKGGIGKSTTTTALSCAMAKRGLKVFQIGCDPKADSTLYLHGGKRIPAILDVIRKKKDMAELDDLVVTGYHGILCAESGGPMPGLGCAGRGIAAAFEVLEEREAFSILRPDVVLYDVLGDVVCGGFAMPIREGYADQVYIVTSGENMAIYAAANIAMAVDAFRDRGYATLGGVILNRRNVPDEREKVEQLCRDIHTEIAADLPRDNSIAMAEEAGELAAEKYPDCPFMKAVDGLAETMLKNGVDRPIDEEDEL